MASMKQLPSCAALIDLRPSGMCKDVEPSACESYRVGHTVCRMLADGSSCRRSLHCTDDATNGTRVDITLRPLLGPSLALPSRVAVPRGTLSSAADASSDAAVELVLIATVREHA